MMFEQFRSTRKHVDDLREALGADIYYGAGCPGLVYCDEFYIEERSESWTDVVRARGRYFLVIGNRDWLSDDIESLERELWDYAVGQIIKR